MRARRMDRDGDPTFARTFEICGWPGKPKVLASNGWALSVQLRRIAANLRAAGLDVNLGEKTPGKGSKRIIAIKKLITKGLAETSAIVETANHAPDQIRRFPRYPEQDKQQQGAIRRFPRLA